MILGNHYFLENESVSETGYTLPVYKPWLDEQLPGELEAVIVVTEQFSGAAEGLEVALYSCASPSPLYGLNRLHSGPLRFATAELRIGAQFKLPFAREQCAMFMTLGLLVYPNGRKFTHGKLTGYVRQR